MVGKNTVPDHVWDKQADLYELGFKNGNEIARELGVSPQTVSRQMNRRGARKGSRVEQSIESLEAFLDRKSKRAKLMELTDSARRQRGSENRVKAIGYMIAALQAADRQGDLTLAAPLIDCMGKAMGSKSRKERKKH